MTNQPANHTRDLGLPFSGHPVHHLAVMELEPGVLEVRRTDGHAGRVMISLPPVPSEGDLVLLQWLRDQALSATNNRSDLPEPETGRCPWCGGDITDTDEFDDAGCGDNEEKVDLRCPHCNQVIELETRELTLVISRKGREEALEADETWSR